MNNLSQDIEQILNANAARVAAFNATFWKPTEKRAAERKWKEIRAEATSALTQLFNERLIELIGEDEPRTPVWEPQENFMRMGRNQLRRQLRAQLKEAQQ